MQKYAGRNSRKLGETFMKIALLPIGSFEQHGSFLPLNTDTIIAEEVAKRICKKLKIMCLPPLEYSLSEEHFGFFGTVSLSGETFRNCIKEIFDSVKRFGTEKLLIFSWHGGNTKTLDSFNIKAIEIISFACFDLMAKELWKDYKGVHADELETSLMLAIDEKMVKLDKLVDEIPNKEPSKLKEIGMKSISKSGVWGKPSRASKEKGKLLLNKCVNTLCDNIRKQYNIRLTK